jgi:hypothetical protein
MHARWDKIVTSWSKNHEEKTTYLPAFELVSFVSLGPKNMQNKFLPPKTCKYIDFDPQDLQILNPLFIDIFRFPYICYNVEHYCWRD